MSATEAIYDNIIEDLTKKHFKKTKNNRKKIIVGLGSGSTVATLVKKMDLFKNEDNFEFITTSIQIKNIADKIGLSFTDESKITELDMVLDGADQVDHNLNMIKGGGGALFKEKILIYSSKKTLIFADNKKFVKGFTRSIPLEVHPFARYAVEKKLNEINVKSSLRTLSKGYPFMTENGNIIFELMFNKLPKNIEQIENELKNIPGVIEVGIFAKMQNTYYYFIDKNKISTKMRR